jgi:hypothetical protein
MNESEARLHIVTLISDILFELSDGDDLSSADRTDLRESMADTADVIAEALDHKVIAVDGDVAQVTVRVSSE